MKIKELMTNTLDPIDSEVLLSHVIGKPRAWILARPDEAVDQARAEKFKKLAKQRAAGEPVAYLIGKKEFYGRNFLVDRRVHIPKPDTECMIDAIRSDFTANFSGIIADIGTGSGCVAITLAKEFPRAKIIATDISKNALDAAKKNARALEVAGRIEFRQGNLLSPINKKIDLIAANLPYGWKKNWTQDKQVMRQPAQSYCAGEDGLLYITKLINQLEQALNKKGRAFLEFDPRQKNALYALCKEKHFDFCFIKDLSGHDRVLKLKF